MVAASGSTEPVSVFDINGAVPWLYLDLPDAALTSFLAAVNSDWFHEGAGAKAFSLSNTRFVVQDKYWFAPTAEVWNATKAIGDWRIDARHSLVELIIIYGGGVGRVWATGNVTINFTISSGMPGDFNNDGSIDTADYLVWRKSLGQTGAGLAADGNADHRIDDEDYAMWRTHYGDAIDDGTPASSTVPEPLAAAIVLEGVLMILFRRRTDTRT
jgi:hypothetical protein